MMRKATKALILMLFLALTAVRAGRPAVAQGGPPNCEKVIICQYPTPPGNPLPPPDDGGGGGGGGGGQPPEPQPIVNPPPLPPCGDFVRYVKIFLTGSMCYYWVYTVDCETGRPVPLDDSHTGPCPQPEEPTTENPCENLTAAGGSLVCSGVGDVLEARVSLPPFTVDLYPWPAGLVGWPGLLRLAEMNSDTGSDTRSYIARAGGSSDNPKVGDWRNVVFTLSLNPVPPGLVQVVGFPGLDGTLLRKGDPPTPVTFELPSHPDAGGVPAPAARVGLPADFPAFAGRARGAYTLSWKLEWEEYVRKKIGEECREINEDEHVDPDERCTTADGKPGKLKDIYEYKWEKKSAGGIIDPDWVVGLPAEYKADLNGDVLQPHSIC